MKRFLFILLVGSIALVHLNGCKQIDLYEYNHPISKNEWSREEPIKGSFTISDTNHLYNIYIVLRHRDAYNYNNIWLNIGLQPPSDTMSFQKVNLSLGDDSNGWEGVGVGDIWEVRKLISGKPRAFARPGTYYYSIGHIMRDNPLKNVMSVGMRIERMN
jgi:gliding motility-associated lipoprotein GldH